uniref:Uncharacterized protein n=1 Tax=Arundo donax TaxID=35708 RepID=A0A0A8XRF3_ARUDO
MVLLSSFLLYNLSFLYTRGYYVFFFS